MKYSHRSGLNAIMRIAKAMQGTPNGTKEYFIIQFIVPQTNRIKRMWHSENDMKMIHWQSFIHELFNPNYLLYSQAFGAISIATTIITITNSPT